MVISIYEELKAERKADREHYEKLLAEARARIAELKAVVEEATYLREEDTDGPGSVPSTLALEARRVLKAEPAARDAEEADS